MNENQMIAKQVVQAIGGEDNIISFAHCATRLRIMVRDKDSINQEQVEGIDKVKGAFLTPDSIRLFSAPAPSTVFLRK